MKAQTCSISTLIVAIVFLAIIQSSNCRPISTATTQPSNAEQRLRYNSRYAPLFLSSMESMRNKKTNPIHAVSRRLVPEGPNPLHNWLDTTQGSNVVFSVHGRLHIQIIDYLVLDIYLCELYFVENVLASDVLFLCNYACMYNRVLEISKFCFCQNQLYKFWHSMKFSEFSMHKYCLFSVRGVKSE